MNDARTITRRRRTLTISLKSLFWLTLVAAAFCGGYTIAIADSGLILLGLAGADPATVAPSLAWLVILAVSACFAPSWPGDVAISGWMALVLGVGILASLFGWLSLLRRPTIFGDLLKHYQIFAELGDSYALKEALVQNFDPAYREGKRAACRAFHEGATRDVVHGFLPERGASAAPCTTG